MADEPDRVREMIGYLPESNPLYEDMPVLDALKFAARIQNVPRERVEPRIREMVEACGLGLEKHKRIGELSKGYRQRVGLAQAMVHDPQVLILDEPTSGLDPNQIVEIRSLIKDLGTAKTVIFSTHILSEVEAVCDRILIINRGQIVADGTYTIRMELADSNASQPQQNAQGTFTFVKDTTGSEQTGLSNGGFTNTPSNTPIFALRSSASPVTISMRCDIALTATFSREIDAMF